MDGETFDEQDPVKLYVPKRERREKFTIDAHAPIGVFDSGVGGLTVVRELMRQIPATRRGCPTAQSRGTQSYAFRARLCAS